MKLRRLVWSGYVAHMDGNEKCIKNLIEKLKGKGPFLRLGVGGRITFKCILETQSE
jgi:hypothetical protein